MSVVLTNSGDKAKRRELDFYPTPSNVTVALMKFLALKPSCIWEPACGDGAMSSVLLGYGHDVISTELRTSNYGESGVDFLLADPRKCDAIITNPPFNLSSEFIEKAIGIAPVVAMLLKSQYWHAQKRLLLFDKFKPAYVLPLTWRPDFLYDQRKPGDKSSPTMDVLWTVWVAGDSITKYQPIPRPSETRPIVFNDDDLL